MGGTIWGAEALSSREAAAYCGRTWQWLIQGYKDWGIPVQRVGGQLVFLMADLDKFMANRSSQARPHP